MIGRQAGMPAAAWRRSTRVPPPRPCCRLALPDAAARRSRGLHAGRGLDRHAGR
jgi:hypothetical protein